MFENIERTSKKVNPLLEKGEITPNTNKVTKSEAEKKQNSRRNVTYKLAGKHRHNKRVLLK